MAVCVCTYMEFVSVIHRYTNQQEIQKSVESSSVTRDVHEKDVSVVTTRGRRLWSLLLCVKEPRNGCRTQMTEEPAA